MVATAPFWAFLVPSSDDEDTFLFPSARPNYPEASPTEIPWAEKRFRSDDQGMEYRGIDEFRTVPRWKHLVQMVKRMIAKYLH